MLIAILGASLLRNVLAGKAKTSSHEVIRAG